MKPLSSANAAAERRRASWYHQDNGFSSREAMDRAHRPLLAYARRILVDAPPGGPRPRVLDLGCGNGALVGRIADLHPEVIPAGVERDGFKIERARRLQPKYADEFRTANLFDPAATESGGPAYYLTILMLGRLIEVPPEAALALLERLRRRTHRLLVYAYDDYVRQTMPFASMALRAGLELLRPATAAHVSLARLGDAAAS